MLTAAGASPPESLILSVSGTETFLAAEPQTGASVFGRNGDGYGTTTYFYFSVPGQAIRNATSFSIGSQSFPIDSKIFIVPSLTTMSDRTINLTIATLASASCDNLVVQIAAPFPQAGSLAPKISVKELGPETLLHTAELVDEYAFCEGSWQLDRFSTGAIIVKVLTEGKVLDSLIVDRGVAGW
jgi:hypothetical protein